jgi:hypothetical protein
MSSGASPRSHSWTFRPACDDDVDGLVALHWRVFGRVISRDQWLWKLGPQPGPIANVWIAEADGRPVFQYAGIVTRVRHCASLCWAMIDVDTMTDPDYRRRGLLTQGATATYAHWRKVGIAFTVGLPNEQWGSRAGALGWVAVGELRWWVRWLNPVGMLAAKTGIGRLRSASVRRERFRRRLHVAPVHDPAPFDELWKREGNEGLVRDAAWFRWRYLEAIPKWRVLAAWEADQPVGGASYHLDTNRDYPSGLIGEVWSSNFDAMRLLLGGCCDDLRAMGAVRAALLVQPGSALEEAALAAGFLPRPGAFSVEAVDLGGGLPRTAHFQGGDFDAV